MNGKLSPKTQRKGWQSLLAAILTVVLLVGFVTPALSSSESGDPPSTPSTTPPGPPSADRLRELASQYTDINFNPNYTGEMPATEQEALDQLEVLADIRDELEAMSDNVPPAPYDPSGSQAVSDYLAQGVRWRSCDAPIGPIISLLTWFRVRHTVKTVHEDDEPYNITSVSDHSTSPLASGFTINGILVQVKYEERSRWVTGPEYKYIESLRTLKAIWKLWSNYHVHFYAGPFTYSKYDVTRGCQIA